MATSIDKLMEMAQAYGWAAADHEHYRNDDTLDAMEMAEQELRAGLVALSAAPAVQQPAQAEQTDARDAARWRYTAWHIGVAWNEQGFTSLVRIVSDKHREMLGDMVDRMMAGDWPGAAPKPAQQTCNCRWVGDVQVQQCTLHEANVEAIHEWAERAKAAEAKLKAQPDIRTLIADDAYAMTFQSLGHYRSALLAALSAAPQPAQTLTDEQINAGRQALPYDVEDKPVDIALKAQVGKDRP